MRAPASMAVCGPGALHVGSAHLSESPVNRGQSGFKQLLSGLEGTGSQLSSPPAEAPGVGRTEDSEGQPSRWACRIKRNQGPLHRTVGSLRDGTAASRSLSAALTRSLVHAGAPFRPSEWPCSPAGTVHVASLSSCVPVSWTTHRAPSRSRTGRGLGRGARDPDGAGGSFPAVWPGRAHAVLCRRLQKC